LSGLIAQSFTPEITTSSVLDKEDWDMGSYHQRRTQTQGAGLNAFAFPPGAQSRRRIPAFAFSLRLRGGS
jgi:hypothetical protein